MENTKARSFTDLIVWQKAHDAVLNTYKLTNKFPQQENYALTSQMRRAAVSITSNIAEGFSRQSLKEKIQFYYMALGSNTELQNQFIIAKDLNYVSEEEFSLMSNKLITINKLINGLIKSLKQN